MKLFFALILLLTIPPQFLTADSDKPIRALLITGGCCHDYAKQQLALQKGIQARANVQVDVYWTDNSTTAPVFPLYRQLNWADDYDVIIHDECAASIEDQALVNRILQVHQRVPAVHLHCAMHSFRTGEDAWFRHLGLQSNSHGPQEPISIYFEKNNHTITRGLENWTTIREELYNNVKLYGAQPLAIGKQVLPGNPVRTEEAIVAWTNESAGARSFSTSLGHNTETVQDPRYLDLVTRGLLWSCEKLNKEYLVPFQGDTKTTFINKSLFASTDSAKVGKAPKKAMLVKLRASSTQSGHPTEHAIDGDPDTRWCANSSDYPQWLTLDLKEASNISNIEIDWEFGDRDYQLTIEATADSKHWQTLFEGPSRGGFSKSIDSKGKWKTLKFTATRGASGSWCSIREIRLGGDSLEQLWPADPTHKDFRSFQSFAKAGNTTPRIQILTPEEEAEILKGVRVPNGFEATVYAAPPAVNYPVFVAATVDGTLFVSSDGNGSLGRDPARGRVIRLRDMDGDGRADETKVFCEVDAPRGLLWDRDRLFVMHPPHLSVFFDHDGDGVADEQKTLVKNLAFGYYKRPADHTTNGLSIGVDGWLYLAGGDFGFMNAEGTDGRRITHRGGGVLRVRPDGTGLEIYSTGTRNILEVAISPEMEMFARDNTNDGGGWDVRLHHFTGNEDHGYPRLYKNFNNECVQPLADYGGGSGCGAAYLSEPGFGKWNNAPLTADWGTGALYHHQVQRKGSTFIETQSPTPFIKLPRPTDADVDGNSRVYCASWLGATFNWNGPNVGYVLCVRPKDFVPEPMPQFLELPAEQLVEQFASPSHRRRLAAQRELFYRDDARYKFLYSETIAKRPKPRNLLDHLQNVATDQECVAELGHPDKLVVHTAIRVLGKRNAYEACFSALDRDFEPKAPVFRALAMMHSTEVVDGLKEQLSRAEGDTRRQVLSALCRLHFHEGEWKGNSWGTRPDTRGPYYQPEDWNGTEQVAGILNQALANAPAEEAAFLAEAMRANRIESNDAMAKLTNLAIENDAWSAEALKQLALAKNLPAAAPKLLQQLKDRPNLSIATQLDALSLALRIRDSAVLPALLDILDRLREDEDSRRSGEEVNAVMAKSSSLDYLGQELATRVLNEAGDSKGLSKSAWCVILSTASRRRASPEARQAAQEAIRIAWRNPKTEAIIIEMASWLNNHLLDQEIWDRQNSPNSQTAAAARRAISRLAIKAPKPDNSPLLKSMELSKALSEIQKTKGDSALGRRIFEKANCAACHTTTQAVAQKGPYLGNIAKTYKRDDLSIAILDPNRTIAQGFATNSILTVDGNVITGFVTDEQNETVVLRDQQGKEHVIPKDDVDLRKTLKTSVMPAGIMDEFTTYQVASLIDYLTSLSAGK
ncbi:MAG: ThuA domain-containing protein [Planctomycetota bacterium]